MFQSVGWIGVFVCGGRTGRSIRLPINASPWIAFAIISIAGCAESPKNFTPPMVSAEEAVRRGLDAWKAGQKPGELPGQPKVYVTDTGRKSAQILKAYKILGETRGTSGRTIAVTLQMENPEEEIKARYIVVGIDPLWVWRQEDYELLMHWEHRMPDPKDVAEKPIDDQQKPTEEKGVVDEKSLDAARASEETELEKRAAEIPRDPVVE